MIKDEKRKLRKKMRSLLQADRGADITRANQKIFDQLINFELWLSADTILVYLSLPEEPDTGSLIKEALDTGKAVGLPRIHDGNLDFHRITGIDTPWQINQYGIGEPPDNLPILEPGMSRAPSSASPTLPSSSAILEPPPDFSDSPSEAAGPTLCFVPGLAFDNFGRRLGRGGGYYDRYLARYGSVLTTIGLAFSFQLVEQVPVTEQDYVLNYILTDDGLIECRPLPDRS